MPESMADLAATMAMCKLDTRTIQKQVVKSR
jgi:hypothetical protein